MNRWIDQLISGQDLSDAERVEIRRAVATDAELARLASRWEGVRSAIRDELNTQLGDPELFTMYVLYISGHEKALSSDEREIIRKMLSRFEALTRQIPAAHHIVGDLRAAANEFSSLWDDQIGEFGEREAAELAPQRPQRKPVRVPSRVATRRRGTRSDVTRWSARIAIAAAVVAFAFILTQIVQRDAGMTTIRTADDEVRLIDLTEGSRIRLLEGSELSYPNVSPSSSLLSQAFLSGRAFFEIAPAERGFIVKTSNARITVLGTSFGVEALERLTEVVLAEGRLTLASEEHPDAYVALQPGQMSRIAADGLPLEPVSVALPERLAWTGLFVFQSEPLYRIGQILTAHFDTALTIDAAIANERITGTFDHNQPLDEILSIIAEALGVDVVSADSGERMIRPR